MTASHVSSLSISSRRRFAVAVGGALGTTARWTVADVIGAAGINPLWGTFAVNVVGSIVLGFLVGYHNRRARSMPYLIPFAGIGVLGAFTTFSLFSTEVLELVILGDWSTVVLYVGGTLLAGFVGAFTGLRFGRAV